MSDRGIPTFQDRQKALAHLVSLVPAADESMSIGHLIQHAYAWASQTGSAAQQEIHGLVETLTRTPQVEALPPKTTDDPLVVLLYLLLRDHIHTGVFESLVAELGQGQEASLTNPYLAAYAVGVAERLRFDGERVPSGDGLTIGELVDGWADGTLCPAAADTITALVCKKIGFEVTEDGYWPGKVLIERPQPPAQGAVAVVFPNPQSEHRFPAPEADYRYYVPEPVPPSGLTPEHQTALADCISVTSRMASSYERYGGVEVGPATRLAVEALEILAIDHETEVEEP